MDVRMLLVLVHEASDEDEEYGFNVSRLSIRVCCERKLGSMND